MKFPDKTKRSPTVGERRAFRKGVIVGAGIMGLIWALLAIYPGL